MRSNKVPIVPTSNELEQIEAEYFYLCECVDNYVKHCSPFVSQYYVSDMRDSSRRFREWFSRPLDRMKFNKALSDCSDLPF